jgi:hypothetical protein
MALRFRNDRVYCQDYRARSSERELLRISFDNASNLRIPIKNRDASGQLVTSRGLQSEYGVNSSRLPNARPLEFAEVKGGIKLLVVRLLNMVVSRQSSL